MVRSAAEAAVLLVKAASLILPAFMAALVRSSGHPGPA
jgi:hypothetical protein